MRSSVGLLFGAVLLAVAGGVCLYAGRFERRMGIAQEDMAVLDFVDPQTDYAALQQDLEKLPWVSSATLEDIRVRRATLQYWQDDFEDLAEMAKTPPAENEKANPDLLLLAANASFRMAQRGPQDKVTLLKNLDGVVRAYSDALSAGSDSPDAAYNYELVVKIRDEVANGKQKTPPLPKPNEQKSDSSMHGDPGEPPKDLKTDQFQIRIPADPKDLSKSQQETAGTGVLRRRRG